MGTAPFTTPPVIANIATAVVLVTSAQLLALHTTPVTIVPAPGAGKAILILGRGLALSFVAGASAYVSTGSDEGLYYGVTSNLASGAAVASTLTGASSAIATQNGAASTNPALLNNQPIVLYGPTANMTAGNGTATVTVIYAIAQL
jgi:hypothetical protein